MSVPPEMSLDDQAVLDEASIQLNDLAAMACGELDGCTPAEQISLTREALHEARKVIDRYQRKVDRQTARGTAEAT